MTLRYVAAELRRKDSYHIILVHRTVPTDIFLRSTSSSLRPCVTKLTCAPVFCDGQFLPSLNIYYLREPGPRHLALKDSMNMSFSSHRVSF